MLISTTAGWGRVGGGGVLLIVNHKTDLSALGTDYGIIDLFGNVWIQTQTDHHDYLYQFIR